MIYEFDEELLKKNINNDPLCQLIKNDKLNEIIDLVNSGYKIDNNIYLGITPLMFAANLNNTKIAQILIDLGANTNSCDDNMMTPLMYTIHNNAIDVAKLLLNTKDINIDAINTLGDTALITAVRQNKIELIKLLIASNANVNACSKEMPVLTISMLLYPKDNTISNLLIDAGADVSFKGSNLSPLMIAAQQDNIEIAKKIYFQSGYMMEKNILTALVLPGWAIKHNSSKFLDFYLKNTRMNFMEYILLLIEATKDVSLDCIVILLNNYDKKDDLLNWLATVGCIYNEIEFLKICKDFNYDFNDFTTYDMTPLMIACYSNDSTDEIIKLLLNYGVNLNIQDKYGTTALMYAASKNKKTTIQLLLENGADKKITDNNNKDFNFYLKNNDKRDFEQLFLNRNKDKLIQIESKRKDDIPDKPQNFYDRFEFYLQKYFERYPESKTSEIYNSCFMDRRTFSKLRNGKHKEPPHRETVISLALGLKLSLNETEDLMNCAGYHFSERDKTDVEIVKLLSEKNYNGFEWSAQIYQKTKIIFFKSLPD